MEKEFTRIRSAKDLTISMVLTLLGCALVALPTSTSINICGFFLICAGIILFFMLKSAYKDTATGMKYSKTEKFFAQNQREMLLESINNARPEKLNVSEEGKGNNLRLDIYHCTKSGKAYLQVFEYVPYKYEPCSRQFEYEISAVAKLLGK